MAKDRKQVQSKMFSPDLAATVITYTGDDDVSGESYVEQDVILLTGHGGIYIDTDTAHKLVKWLGERVK